MNWSETTALVTGGTGSFGRQAVDFLRSKGCGEIRIFSRDEAKQESMRHEYSDPNLRFYIGDVRSQDATQNAMRGVDLVFHAAALKQVPSCDFFPMEAVRTNIVGSANVVEAAVSCGAKQVVCLSTDKAVMPINAMGMSKALMEKTAQAIARDLGSDKTVISCVRYGNVMYSRGSVIPLFVNQIKNGLPLTITEPSMTRFMLALTDAMDLVEFAFSNAKQGDLFIKKAPACTVEDLAQALLSLFETDNPIEILGMRHGEKLYETLATAEELRRAEDMGGYYRVQADNRDLNYAKYVSEGDPVEISIEDYHSHNTERLDLDQLTALLMTLPEVRAERDAWLGKSIQ